MKKSLIFLLLLVLPELASASVHFSSTSYMTDTSYVPASTTMTYMGWYQVDNTSTNNTVFAAYQGTGEGSYRYMSTWTGGAAALLQVWTAGTPNIQPSPKPTPATWYWFRTVHNVSTGLFSFAMWNGSSTLIASSSRSDVASNRPNSVGIRIGHSNVNDNSPFNGCMRNLMAFNSQITDASATALMFTQDPSTSSMAAFFPLAFATDTREFVNNFTSTVTGTPTLCATDPPFSATSSPPASTPFFQLPNMGIIGL